MAKDLRITISKSKKRLEVLEGDDLIRSFDVTLGSDPIGSKELEGDGKTPEGEYLVCVKNPESKFHLSLGLNYPNRSDAKRGLRAGLINEEEFNQIVAAIEAGKMPPQDTALGGEIYIHGGGTDGDWTRGCVGLSNDEMTELFEAIPVGTHVLILP